MLRVAVIGLGRRSVRHAIPYLVQKKTQWQLEAVCDSSSSTIDKLRATQPTISHIPSFSDVSSMISSKSIDSAYVAVPHYQGSGITEQLLSSKIHVIREKPAALTAAELTAAQELARTNGVTFNTASQFRHCEQARQMRDWMPLLGKIRFVEGRKVIAVNDLGQGWRASRVLSGGGALIDVGWHLVDLVLSLFSAKEVPAVRFAQLMRTRVSQEYDCEDTTRAIFDIHNSELAARDGIVSCSLFISRLGPKETSRVTVYGEQGELQLEDDRVHLGRGETSEAADFSTGPSPFHQMMDRIHGIITEPGRVDEREHHRRRDMITMKTIDSIYSAGRPINDGGCGDGDPLPSAPDCRFSWPLIDEPARAAVQKQLHDSVSIYDNGGIFGQFEKAWQELHTPSRSFALLHNSGTNALHAMYFAANLQPGDEVIFPAYSFHATSSPAMHFGIVPVFCDSLEDGTISPEAIRSAITPRTKAVVVTHLWGMPCNMKAVSDVLKDHPRIFLFEDCSHAHGATIDGQMVGTFGDAAAWSLQGQKIISGGEGGITLTRHPELYHRQLIWGHYNKRCEAEIPHDHPLRPFSLTGAGLKNRAHPLAVALAFSQLKRFDSIRRTKTLYATQMISRLAGIPFLETPSLAKLGMAQIEPAWYALLLRFIPSRAPATLDRDSFVAELHHRGLCDVDIPRSTRLLHQEPLYTQPEKLFPHLYPGGIPSHAADRDFPVAQSFCDAAIKLAVWTTRQDQPVVDHYLDTICDVADKHVPTS